MRQYSRAISSEGHLMLPAKLFGALVVLLVLFAISSAVQPFGAVDIYLHGAYLVVGLKQLRLSMALLSTVFAIVYFAAARWSPSPLNRWLSLAHFACIVVGLVILEIGIATLGGFRFRNGTTYFASATLAGNADPPVWPIFGLFLGELSIIAGVCIFVANLCFTAIKVLQVRLRA